MAPVGSLIASGTHEVHRLAQQVFDWTSEIVADDAQDGLGNYRAFHSTDNDLGAVAFVAYENAPDRALNVLIDAAQSTQVSVALLLQLLSDIGDKLSWVPPEVVTKQRRAR